MIFEGELLLTNSVANDNGDDVVILDGVVIDSEVDAVDVSAVENVDGDNGGRFDGVDGEDVVKVDGDNVVKLVGDDGDKAVWVKDDSCDDGDNSDDVDVVDKAVVDVGEYDEDNDVDRSRCDDVDKNTDCAFSICFLNSKYLFTEMRWLCL